MSKEGQCGEGVDACEHVKQAKRPANAIECEFKLARIVGDHQASTHERLQLSLARSVDLQERCSTLSLEIK